MRNTTIMGAAIVALLSIASVPAHAPVAAVDDAAPMPERSVEIMAHLATSFPEPVRSVRMREYLYRASDHFADAYVDRNEDQLGRVTRLERFASGIADALEADWRIGVVGDDYDWKYGLTLVCIAHRETRIAKNPAKLGNQDNGRAHGPWQIWGWHGRDPMSAETALDMLFVAPSSSWSLPKDQPWIGYPECAKWMHEHPFE